MCLPDGDVVVVSFHFFNIERKSSDVKSISIVGEWMVFFSWCCFVKGFIVDLRSSIVSSIGIPSRS